MILSRIIECLGIHWILLLKYQNNILTLREDLFNKIKAEISPGTTGFRAQCPSRWRVRASSLSSIISNFDVIQAVWEEALDIARDSETHAQKIIASPLLNICLV